MEDERKESEGSWYVLGWFWLALGRVLVCFGWFWLVVVGFGWCGDIEGH